MVESCDFGCHELDGYYRRCQNWASHRRLSKGRVRLYGCYTQSGSEDDAMKIPAEIKQMINEKARAPRIHFATSTKDGKPNVVPIGYVEVISEEEVLIVDTLMDKTRKNLETNPQVAIAVEVMEEFKAYQLKGKARIFTEGKVFEKALEVQKRRNERRKLRYAREGIEQPEWARELHQRKPKAAILVKVEEIYSTANPEQE